MKNMKSVVAIAGVVILVLLYVFTFIAAFTAKPYANGLFMASAFSTVIIPIMIYGFIVIYRLMHKNDDENTMSLHEYRKKQKEWKKEQKQEKSGQK